MTFNEDSQKKSTAAQIKKYGGMEGYRAEMRRRSLARKTFAPGKGGFRWMKEHDPERFKQILENRKKG